LFVRVRAKVPTVWQPCRLVEHLAKTLFFVYLSTSLS
jgi:hypothetical protein